MNHVRSDHPRENSRIRWPVPAGPAPSDAPAGPGLLGIGEVARRFNLTLRALRFYEARGLIQPIRDGNARYYRARDLVRIELILKGKGLGFTLGEIVSMLGDGRDDLADLIVTPDQLLGQIEHLEQQHRAIERALGALRKRYVLLRDALPA